MPSTTIQLKGVTLAKQSIKSGEAVSVTSTYSTTTKKVISITSSDLDPNPAVLDADPASDTITKDIKLTLRAGVAGGGDYLVKFDLDGSTKTRSIKVTKT